MLGAHSTAGYLPWLLADTVAVLSFLPAALSDHRYRRIKRWGALVVATTVPFGVFVAEMVAGRLSLLTTVVYGSAVVLFVVLVLANSMVRKGKSGVFALGGADVRFLLGAVPSLTLALGQVGLLWLIGSFTIGGVIIPIVRLKRTGEKLSPMVTDITIGSVITWAVLLVLIQFGVVVLFPVVRGLP